jgi:hypothetical protein
LNHYAYAENDPVNFIDPNGRTAFAAAPVVAAAPILGGALVFTAVVASSAVVVYAGWRLGNAITKALEKTATKCDVQPVPIPPTDPVCTLSHLELGIVNECHYNCADGSKAILTELVSFGNAGCPAAILKSQNGGTYWAMNPFDSLGIPKSEGLNFVSLGYSRSAEACIISLVDAGGASILVRGRAEQAYRTVTPPVGYTLDVKFIVDSHLSRAYTVLHERYVPVLGVVELPSGECSCVIPRLEGGDDKRVWVADLLGMSGSVQHSILVKVGIAPAKQDHSFRVRYCICTMCSETGFLEELVELTTPFG